LQNLLISGYGLLVVYIGALAPSIHALALGNTGLFFATKIVRAYVCLQRLKVYLVATGHASTALTSWALPSFTRFKTPLHT